MQDLSESTIKAVSPLVSLEDIARPYWFYTSHKEIEKKAASETTSVSLYHCLIIPLGFDTDDVTIVFLGLS